MMTFVTIITSSPILSVKANFSYSLCHTNREDTVQNLCYGCKLLSASCHYNCNIDNFVKNLCQVLRYILEICELLLNLKDNYPDNFVVDTIQILQISCVDTFNTKIKILGQQLTTNTVLTSTNSVALGFDDEYSTCLQAGCSTKLNLFDNFLKLLTYISTLYSETNWGGSWDVTLTNTPLSGFTAANLSTADPSIN